MSISKFPLSFDALRKNIAAGLENIAHLVAGADNGNQSTATAREIQAVVSSGAISLCWAAATPSQNYVNLGDALSPVIVAALSGLPVRHMASRSVEDRMSAIGTIGQSLVGGRIDVWGTGCSNFANPLATGTEKRPYTLPPDTILKVHATRGPISWRLLTGTEPGPEAVFGDPGWLLPRFYRPSLSKTAELGVILHLSELADRAFEVHPKPNLLRYAVPPQFEGKVRLINTITPISAEGLRANLDEILSCKRIVSTSLHGLVFAETYGIPCLYLQARRGPVGLTKVTIGEDDGMNLRMSDFYAGLGEEAVYLYNQPRLAETDWDAVIAAIDSTWQPKTLDENRLISAFPGRLAPIATSDIFAHSLVSNLPFQPIHEAQVAVDS
ncbi:polysaccharide pyruvyl transferase family protein [Gluconacetobacter tumulisoli]|uniref:Polysaccharide pyruvyl transferase family protein n=1 Tax=Gluconacetobacter tumulisoli TaxID=1286189 RepID=A0A7W4K682_9PROT|nr:polysaccharide pyruvyl transferase family protein [Gluconacetobacter tumulisoli]MBB2201132.1 polysaccharide pyruvyl transferase family protein [Gluconacetobacter tumulisoli]